MASMLRRSIRVLALVAALGACGRAAPGRGTIQGVSYTIDLAGGYRMTVHDGREHVWMPDDTSAPWVLVLLGPRSHEASGATLPCDPRNDKGHGTSDGGVLFVRGDPPFLRAGGATVSTSICIPPGDEGMSCTAYYEDGKLDAAREKVLADLCHTLRLR